MPVSDNPIRPLQRSLQSVFRRLADPRFFMPFLILAVCKAAVLVGAARFDLLPVQVMAAILWVFPQGAEVLHYPETLDKLPHLARWMDRVLFVTLGALLHGWAIVYLVRLWTKVPLQLFPTWRSGVVRFLALGWIAALVLLVPFGTQWVARQIDHSMATIAALGAGFIVQMLLFVAPAFLVIEGRSLWQSIRASLGVVAAYPIAMPLVIVVLAALHAPVLALRLPGLFRGISHDPDWILYALLVQIPVDFLGALVAAGLAARLALTYRSRRQAL